MEIKGINSKLSGSGKIALVLEPPLTNEMLSEIKKMTEDSSRTPLLSNLQPYQNIQGCLVFYCPGTVTEHIANNVSEMLKKAEEMAAETQKIKRDEQDAQASLEQRGKDNSVNSAAQAFGVPVE
jgi:hypothetical protein